MIRRNYYQALERTATTAEKEEIKSGVNVSFYYLLERLAKVIKSTYLVSGNYDDAAKVNKFVDVLDLNKNYLFGDAISYAMLICLTCQEGPSKEDFIAADC